MIITSYRECPECTKGIDLIGDQKISTYWLSSKIGSKSRVYDMEGMPPYRTTEKNLIDIVPSKKDLSGLNICILCMLITRHPYCARCSAETEFIGNTEIFVPKVDLDELERSGYAYSSSVWKCPTGCGFLPKSSPIDRLYHCSNCEQAFKFSEVVDFDSEEAEEDRMQGVKEWMDGDDIVEFQQSLALTFDHLGRSIRDSWLKERRLELEAMVEHVQSETGIKLSRLAQMQLLGIILMWGDDGGKRDVPEPEPENPREKELA